MIGQLIDLNREIHICIKPDSFNGVCYYYHTYNLSYNKQDRIMFSSHEIGICVAAQKNIFGPKE